MKYLVGILSFAFSLSAFASGQTLKTYKLDCLVYGPGVAFHKIYSPKSMENISVYKAKTTEYFVGAIESTSPPNTKVTVQFQLSIEQDGKLVAQSVADYGNGKYNPVLLRTTDELPVITCTPAR